MEGMQCVRPKSGDLRKALRGKDLRLARGAESC